MKQQLFSNFTLFDGSRNCSMVLIPESTKDLAFAGPIPATRVKRLIAVLESSERICNVKKCPLNKMTLRWLKFFYILLGNFEL